METRAPTIGRIRSFGRWVSRRDWHGRPEHSAKSDLNLRNINYCDLVYPASQFAKSQKRIWCNQQPPAIFRERAISARKPELIGILNWLSDSDSPTQRYGESRRTTRDDMRKRKEKNYILNFFVLQDLTSFKRINCLTGAIISVFWSDKAIPEIFKPHLKGTVSRDFLIICQLYTLSISFCKIK